MLKNDDDCFCDLKNSLVPLIEGLCGSDSTSQFCVRIFGFSFSEEKYVEYIELLVQNVLAS